MSRWHLYSFVDVYDWIVISVFFMMRLVGSVSAGLSLTSVEEERVPNADESSPKRQTNPVVVK